MASSKKLLDYILDQLNSLDGITYKQMMGEYIIYYRSRIAGGIYDDRLLIKPVKAAVDYISNKSHNTIKYKIPYTGAKEMILIEDIDDKEFLVGLFEYIYEELPKPKVK